MNSEAPIEKKQANFMRDAINLDGLGKLIRCRSWQL